MKEIHVKFAGVEKTQDGQFSIVYIPNEQQVLQPGERYHIIIDDLGYAESKPEEAERSKSLTPRELEIVGLIAQGLPNKVIAVTLSMTEQTVKNHVTSILEHLGARNRVHAVALAKRGRLI